MSALGILNPAGAVALGVVAVLIALHLRERRRAEVPVATLFLWRRVVPEPAERRRFRPSGTFWLQLALLLTLIGGLVRPYLEGPATAPSGRALLVVLDVSASMQAREAAGSRFALARRDAAALLAGLGADDEAMLVTADDRAHVVERWTRDHTRLRHRLEALAPRDTPTNLTPALTLALAEARARPRTRTVVLTDLPPEESGVAADALAGVDWVQVGATDDNLAIAGLRVDVPPFRDAAATVATVVVRNYAGARRRAVLGARVGGEPWAWQTLALEPGATEHVSLADPPREGILEVELYADDALAVDNRAVAWVSRGAALDLLLVSDSDALTGAFAEIVAAIPGSRVEVMSPARYAERLPAGRRVALFDGVVPDRVPPAVNALYVAPPAGNPVCPSAGTLAEAAVVDWDEHPALAGLDALQAIASERTSLLGRPDWGVPIVLAASRQVSFPFLVAGTRDGRRLACLAAELSGPLASSDRLPLLMLTLGTLRWLTEPFGGAPATIETGAASLAGPGPRGPVAGPEDGGLRVVGEPPVFLAERAGVYRVGPPGGARLVLANFVDDRESDIGRRGARAWSARAAEPARPAPGPPRELGWWLYVVAILLLLVEWLVWARSRRPLA